MADTAIDHPATEPRQRPPSASVLLPALAFVAAMLIGADFTATSFLSLKALQIPYPKWLEYAHFLIPAACALLWLVSRRKWPNAGAVTAVLLCFTLIGLVPRYAEGRVAKVPVRRWIDSNDLQSLERTLGVPLSEQGSSEGTFVIVAPPNEPRVRAELARLQLLRDPAGE